MPNHVIHLDCSALSDDEFSTVSDFLCDQAGVTGIGVQTAWLGITEEEGDDDDEPLVLNITVSPSQWNSITAGSSDPLESAAKWLIKLLHVWAEGQRDLVVGYDDTQNIVVLGNPEDWN
jgi:hypothetical protein